MAHALRERTTPSALASSRQVIDFTGRLADFERLSTIVDGELRMLDLADRPADWRNAPVTARLEFDFADAQESLPRVRGSVVAAIPAVCQRCLEACSVAVTADVDYLLLTGSQSVSEASGFDVWELAEPAFRPSDLVEEVLVMSLPVSAMHDVRADCGSLADGIAGQGDAAAGDSSERSRPFADLRSLMADKD